MELKTRLILKGMTEAELFYAETSRIAFYEKIDFTHVHYVSTKNILEECCDPVLEVPLAKTEQQMYRAC